MKRMFSIYKRDFLSFGVVSLFFIIFICCCWGKFGVDTFDCGREAYLPQLLLQGKLLYKDIFAMYNPLSYQFNAVLYWLFGASFNTLYWAGIINAYLCLIATYLISRQLLSPLKAVVPSLLFLCLYISNLRNCVEYIFPYSYGMVYATSTFLFFVLFAILFIKNNKIYFTYLASLLLGLSLANRFEFALAYIPFIVYLAVKNKNLKHIIGNILLFLLPIVCSYGLLFLQGFTFADLNEYIKFGQSFFSTAEQKNYHKLGFSVFSIFYTWDKLLQSIIIFGVLLLINIPILKHILKPTYTVRKQVINYIIYLISFNICIFLLIDLLERANIIGLLHVFGVSRFTMFEWIGLSTFYILYKSIQNISSKDGIVITMLALFSICSGVRIGFLFGIGYSIFLGVLPLVLNAIYFLNSKINIEYKKIIIIFLVTLVINNFYLMISIRNYQQTRLETEKGDFYLYKPSAQQLGKMLSWIYSNTNKSDTVLVLPEGPLINFITGRPSVDKYYHLIPNHISALDEDKIVSDLNKNKPDYIIIQKIDYSDYGKAYLGIDYGMKISMFVKNNYKLEYASKDDRANISEFFIFSRK